MLRLTFLVCCVMIGTLLIGPLPGSTLAAHVPGHSSDVPLVKGINSSVQSIVVFVSHSTNTCAVTLVVNSNGDVVVLRCEKTAVEQPPAVVVAKLFSDVITAPPLSNLPSAHPCVKSPSFGTSTVITFAAQVSPDVSCSRDTIGLTLYHDVYDILSSI
ncbi:hypothetical protein KDA_42430 [Dictyobacter alpinus]|uniref:Uncharacterized protein n=1 Tax=Dictyobacter alpinus TaxID=2014873 RepID=A0A402BBP7_9CHLR|nr:hypothetical protein [Dictyobacter alpinus]GCE28759.1 hypothetical protein KDA_42430 [Dictyobacter alpinus]